MKYNSFGVFKKLYSNFTLEYLKQLFQTHIKLAVLTPKKSINYSSRLAHGEKFLLFNKSLYPYNYFTSSDEEFNTSLNISLQLENALLESWFLKNENKGLIKKVPEKKLEILKETIIDTVSILQNRIKYVNEEELDFPVAVYARFIYSKKAKDVADIKEDLIEEESFLKAVKLFFSKIRFCDSESLSYAMCALVKNNIFDLIYWDQIFKRVKEVDFEHELTKVTNCSPYLFRYKEVSKSEDQDIFHNPYGNATYIYMSLKQAVDHDVPGAKESLESFSKRVDKKFCENEYLKLQKLEKI